MASMSFDPASQPFERSPWQDERFVSRSEVAQFLLTPREVVAQAGRRSAVADRLEGWLLQIECDLFPPMAEGHWQTVGKLARAYGTVAVLQMIVGRQRWVAFRPADPEPRMYAEMIVGDDQVLSSDVRGVQLPVRAADWAALRDGLRLLELCVAAMDHQRGGRPRGSRTGMSKTAWLDAAQALRKKVRDEGLSLPGAIAQLELTVSVRQARRWLKTLDAIGSGEFLSNY
jgi:hypothetical protein